MLITTYTIDDYPIYFLSNQSATKNKKNNHGEDFHGLQSVYMWNSSPIQTLTVGSASSRSAVQLADFYRRSGITPCPEEHLFLKK
jgi:hypothetical protein